MYEENWVPQLVEEKRSKWNAELARRLNVITQPLTPTVEEGGAETSREIVVEIFKQVTAAMQHATSQATRTAKHNRTKGSTPDPNGLKPH